MRLPKVSWAGWRLRLVALLIGVALALQPLWKAWSAYGGHPAGFASPRCERCRCACASHFMSLLRRTRYQCAVVMQTASNERAHRSCKGQAALLPVGGASMRVRLCNRNEV